MRLVILALLLAVCHFFGAVQSTEQLTKYSHYLLPKNVFPKKYTLEIVTHLEDPENLRFEGQVEILLKVLQDTGSIMLHSQNLTIDHKLIQITNLRDKSQINCVSSVGVNSEHDYFDMELCKPVSEGEEYAVVIPFSSPLNHKLNGYYKSSYHDKKSNKTRWLSVTQFEPAYARSAFPCFDEPEYKAAFTVILGHQQQYTALSNMPIKEMRPMVDKKGWIWSEFEESVPMSTYLVAYTINDFANAQSMINNGVEFRTWARPDAIEQCKYAGIVGPQVLRYYEDVFNIKFPLKKIDQIAIPDFSAGAMENWGLVTYRETALLYAEHVSSAENKQRVASVIAHELAHQWFGNLVTMKWWTDLWLNEGFATYVASLGLEHISPEWKTLVEESVDNSLAIFRLDALKTSHPISQPIQHVNQIAESFDSISYKKGSTVLRMMHMFLSDKAFFNGISNYLQKYSYSNAEQDNLWAALTESAHVHRALPDHFQIKRIMDSWTLQTGYPVVYVTRDYQRNTATISQSRFLLDTTASRTEDHNCWWVPLSYTTQKMADFATAAPNYWLECDASGSRINITLDEMPASNEWLIFNIQMSGLYKIKYDDANWNLIINTLRQGDFERIHIVNRAQLIDDALTLAWSKDQDYDVAMRLIEYLVREKEYIPWKSALDNLGSVNRILRQTPEYEFFKKFIRKIIGPIYLHLHGLNTTNAIGSHQDTLHKVLIASWACRFDVDDCVYKAKQYFELWRMQQNPDEHNPVPSDLRSVVYCTAARHGNEDDWFFLWHRFKNSNVAAEKRTIISALGCTREVWLLQRYLALAFEEGSHIRKQDSSLVFSAVARSESGFHLARDYFYSNFDLIYKFYAPDISDLSRLLSALASQMASHHDYERMKTFVDTNKQLLVKTEKGVNRALETIHINVQWKMNHYVTLSRNLEERLTML